MNHRLDRVLTRMKDKYRNRILTHSRFYMEVDIGKEAAEMGDTALTEKYAGVYAVVPLKETVDGMKVRIDGRAFVNYVQFESGIAAPGFIAEDTRLPHRPYVAQNSMICNFV